MNNFYRYPKIPLSSKRGGEAGTDDGRAELSTIRLFQNAAPSRSACTISIAGRDRKNLPRCPYCVGRFKRNRR